MSDEGAPLMARVPPSAEVIEEEIERGIEELGVSRDEPCVRRLSRAVAEEIAALWRMFA